jgi:hypothetical protein
VPGTRPGSTDSRGVSPPWPFARADRPRTRWAHHEEPKPLGPGSAHDAESSADDRRIQAQPFQYAMLRIVPRVERGEAVNAGVVLFCRPLRFLGACTALDEALLEALAPGCDADEVRAQLDTLEAVAQGRPEGGHVASMSQSERFHWLTAPASTVVQPSAVHTGLTADPAGELERLFAELVSRPGRRG